MYQQGELPPGLVLGMTCAAYCSKECCMNMFTLLVLGILNSIVLEGCFLVSPSVLYWGCHLPLTFFSFAISYPAVVSLDRTGKQVASAGGFLKQNKKKPCLCGSSDRYLKEKSDRSLVWANIFVLRAAEQIGLTGTNPHLKAVVWNHAGYILSTHEIVFTFQNFFSSAFP